MYFNLNELTQGIQNMLVCATCKSNNISLTAMNIGVSSVLTLQCQKCDREETDVPKLAEHFVDDRKQNIISLTLT